MSNQPPHHHPIPCHQLKKQPTKNSPVLPTVDRTRNVSPEQPQSVEIPLPGRFCQFPDIPKTEKKHVVFLWRQQQEEEVESVWKEKESNQKQKG